MAENAGYDATIARHVEAVNGPQKRILAQKLLDYFDGSLAGRVIALWGLAFKPNTGDMREAPSRTLIESLLSAGASVRAYDPQALHTARQLYDNTPGLVLCEDRNDALAGASALVVVTEWNEFRSPDFKAVKTALEHAMIFDGRNLYDPARLADLGFDYIGIGRRRLATQDGEA